MLTRLRDRSPPPPQGPRKKERSTFTSIPTGHNLEEPCQSRNERTERDAVFRIQGQTLGWRFSYSFEGCIQCYSGLFTHPPASSCHQLSVLLLCIGNDILEFRKGNQARANVAFVLIHQEIQSL